MQFLLRRMLHGLLVFLCVSAFTFILMNAAPGDFFEELRMNPEISSDTLAALRSSYGFDEPVVTRYVDWVRSGLTGDWGFSLAYKSPAGPLVWKRARNTLLLTIAAMLLAWVMAIPIGSWVASKPGSMPDLFLSGVVSALLAIPDLVLALILLVAAVRTRSLPAGGMASIGSSGMGVAARFIDTSRHLFLPAICLAAGLFPILVLHVRTAVMESLRSPFIAAAQAYGIPFPRVLFRHALPAAANPLISLFGLSLGTLVSSSMLIEAIFGWPGLGQLLLEAILQRDFYVVIDAAVLATGFFLAGNLIADILIYANDPRIRVGIDAA
jgi:peptide/nickel transport system permease protein